jgi:flagellar hook-associated protein 3 FlgL
MHQLALEGILQRNADLAKTQNQIAAGKRILTPSDDPTGAVRALDLDRALAESQQFKRNSDMVTNRLSFEEQTLSDMTNLLQRVRDLTVQGANATVDANGRKAIATEIKDRLNELQGLANRKDANGEYLFSGFSTLTQPFGTSASGTVQYAGDQGVRSVQTSPTQKIADGHSGYEVFMRVPTGNGTFATAANAANTGSGVIDSGTVTNPAAWVRGNYTLQFTSATAYQIVNNATSAVVTSGTYSPGQSAQSISFNGVQFTVRGAPATGDTFSINASTTEDMFTTLQKLVTTLARPNVTPQDRAQFDTEMGNTLTQLDRALDHTGDVRADVGSRLSLLDQAAASRDQRELDMNTALSDLRDLDYASAITRLNVQLVGLQAAQSSYSKLGQLSLFNYL